VTFKEVLAQVIDWLQQDKRLSYRALKRQFALDDEYLEDLKVELIEVRRVAVDEEGRVLVWTGTAEALPAPPSPSMPRDRHLETPADHLAQGVPPSGAPHAAAERRQLTVLFCDLVDSTRLAQRFDPEDWREIVRAYQQACATVIQRFDGYIAQYLGDGLLVYFGYPQAHEDDAQRAGHAGLGILQALGPLNAWLEQEKGIRLAVRVGIHTGPVVVGAMGGGERQEQLALGDTPNLAARLQGLAGPDTVVLSTATYHLVQGVFACQALGLHTLKGLAQPVQVYRAVAERMAQSHFEVVAAQSLTPLVGREQEIGLLRERWEQVKEGVGQVVVISGEAGIGKSRLLQVLTAQVANEPHTRLVCRGSPYHQHSALHPVIELVQRALAFERDDPPTAKREKLAVALAAYRFVRDDTMPLLAALLSLPLGDDAPPRSTPKLP
jgi:class 3 adenylate cyclase